VGVGVAARAAAPAVVVARRAADEAALAVDVAGRAVGVADRAAQAAAAAVTAAPDVMRAAVVGAHQVTTVKARIWWRTSSRSIASPRS
jgi:hypothetical protein